MPRIVTPRAAITSPLIHDARMLAIMARPGGETPDEQITALLDAWRHGDETALVRLMNEVQKELHAMAKGLFRGERVGHTLQPTAVINELYLRLEKQKRISLHNRTEFFAVAARLMRRVLVDHARRHQAEKRGSGAVHLGLDDVGLPSQLNPEVLMLDGALLDLERRSPRQSRIIEMRILVGLTLEEIASVEKISLSTVSREWRAGRLFLLSQLRAS